MKAKLVIILDYVWYKKIIVEFFFSKSNNLKDSELDKDHDIGSLVIWKNELILPIRASIKHSNNIIFFKIIFLVQLVNTEQEEGCVCNFTPFSSN